MDVSVIIVNYHSEALISKCIDSIIEKTSGIDYEILIIDNGSDEAGLELLKKYEKDHVKVIDARGNLGFGKANNLGAQHATGRYLFLLNPDTELINNAIRILYDYMEEHPDTGVAGGNLYTQDGRPNPSYCLEFDTLEKEKKESSWMNIILAKVNEKINHKNSIISKEQFNNTGAPLETAYIFGADMFVRKEVFDYVQGFDPDFFMYAEEEELTRRIHNSGYKVMSIPDAEIMHLEGGTTTKKPGFSAKQFAMRMNGKMTYYDKCFPPDGAERFYHYRSQKYKRLIAWQRLKGRKNSEAVRSLEILKQVYAEYRGKER